MRAGRLNTKLFLLDGQTGTALGKLWGDVRPPLEVSEAQGLREAASTKIIIRPRSDIQPGMYLEGRGQLYHIDGEADQLNRRVAQHLSCTRLAGHPGTYTQVGGAEHPVRVWVGRNTPYVGANGQLMDFRYRIEIPAIEQPGRLERGDAITAGGVTFQLTGIDDEGSDGVVVRYTA